jgi:hypothetical protein
MTDDTRSLPLLIVVARPRRKSWSSGSAWRSRAAASTSLIGDSQHRRSLLPVQVDALAKVGGHGRIALAARKTIML